MKTFVALILLVLVAFGQNGSVEKIAKPGYCYSILTEVGYFTPVTESYFENIYAQQSCTLFDQPPLFTEKKAYVGCYRHASAAQSFLKRSNFHFKNPEVVYHRVYDGTPYVIFPNNSHVNFKRALRHLQSIYRNYTIDRVLAKFPAVKGGEGIELYDLDKADFLPAINLYPFYLFNNKQNQKILLLYDGVYSLETIYKKLQNPAYIDRIDPHTYAIKIPIVVLPTASLVIKNKTVYMQTLPHPIFIMYYGKLYAAHSRFYTWNMLKNRYQNRQYVPESKTLYTNYEKPRPYFLGLPDSRGYFVDNVFKGLGFHSTSATFGLSVLLPNQKDFYPVSQSFYYFISHNTYPGGAYIGNDIYDGIMAFYTNGGKNIVYLGNYAHDNVIYNFDPHDYSRGLVIARNIAVGAKKAHGIIISRGCNNNFIAENITIANNANGIMVDRSSNHNFIYNNLSYGNGYMGISSIESRDILIRDNTAVGNLVDGIMVRNSLDVTAEKNRLQFNGKNGLEIMTKNIDRIPGRDFARDPYAKAAAAVVAQNRIEQNYNSNIMVKNGAAIQIKDNTIPNSYGLAGDLNFFYKEILNNKGRFTLYGLGFPFKAQSRDTREMSLHTLETAKQILIDIAKEPNDYVPTTLGGLYLGKDMTHLGKMELMRASSLMSKGALEFLGFVSLGEAREDGYRNSEKIVDGLSYLVESAVLSHNVAKFHMLEKVHFFIPNGADYLEQGFALAMKRMSEGRLFDKEDYGHCPLCDLKNEQKERIRGAYKVFRYKYRRSQKKSLLAYCRYVTRDYTLFTTSAMLYFDKLIDEKNRIKDSVTWYNKKIMRMARANKFCNRYLVKQEKDNRKRVSMMKMEKQKRIDLAMPKLRELLKKINRYRVRKITIRQLQNIMENKIIEDMHVQRSSVGIMP